MVNHFLCIPYIPKAVLPFLMLLNIALLILETEEICPGFVLEKTFNFFKFSVLFVRLWSEYLISNRKGLFLLDIYSPDFQGQ